MENTSNFFNQLKSNMNANLNVALLGTIDKFDAKTMKADVVPLFNDYPMLIELPVMHLSSGGYTIRPVYKQGDIVVVLFADKDIDSIVLSGSKSQDTSTRNHALEDGIVIGSITSFNKPLEVHGAKEDSLYLGSDKVSLELTQDGKLNIKADNVEIDSKLSVNKELEVKGDLKVRTINGGAYPPPCKC